MSDQKKNLQKLIKSVVQYNVDDCRKESQTVLDKGMDPTTAVMGGLVKGMKKVSVLYDTNEYFVPEVLLSTKAFNAGLDILQPHMKKDFQKEKATIVMGSVRGDIHDIGKNLVKAMFYTAGWKVHDLGHDVSLNRFVEKQIEVKADIIAMSAMMTTTMMGMKKVISMVRAKNLDCSILIGGAPLTQDIADLFGADGYAASAGNAVSEGIKLIRRRSALHSDTS